MELLNETRVSQLHRSGQKLNSYACINIPKQYMDILVGSKSKEITDTITVHPGFKISSLTGDYKGYRMY